jgi:hypothetical protein
MGIDTRPKLIEPFQIERIVGDLEFEYYLILAYD